jgi:nucleoside-diphosphate-sugar epimerase
MASSTVLVTGANGFVGRAVVARLVLDGCNVHAATRSQRSLPFAHPKVLQFPGLDFRGNIDWSAALKGVQTIIHCAARVHVMQDSAADPIDEFRRVNVEGSRQLASQAANAGVRRFVFVSSVGVLGGETTSNAFRADDTPAPHTAYAQSKLEAEFLLRQISIKTGIEICIVRPPLVYGHQAPGNFETLLRAIARGIPLPLGSVNNRRSLVAIDNLVDLLVRCADHPAAAGQIFLVSDDDDLSTTELVRRIAKVLGRRSWLLPLPARLLRGVARLVGRGIAAQSLLGSLQLDITKTRNLLDWAPPIGMDEALARAFKPRHNTE